MGQTAYNQYKLNYKPVTFASQNNRTTATDSDIPQPWQYASVSCELRILITPMKSKQTHSTMSPDSAAEQGRYGTIEVRHLPPQPHISICHLLLQLFRISIIYGTLA
jgi:hypothetical protein